MEDRSPSEAETTAYRASGRTSALRRWMGGAMFGLALGAVLLGGTAFAQADAQESDLGQSFFDRLAEKLGLTPDELETTIEETQREVIDDAVADGRLTEEQGDALKERAFSGSGFFRMMPGRHDAGIHAFRQLDISLETIASELGMTAEALRDELSVGATLSEVITEQGSSVENVVAALVADAETKLNEAVADGTLTQEQADRVLANLPERLTQMIESGLPGGCERWFNDDDTTSEDADGADQTTNQV